MIEFHDVPDTKDRKWCWIEILGRTVIYHSSSKETGADLPLEYEHIPE